MKFLKLVPFDFSTNTGKAYLIFSQVENPQLQYYLSIIRPGHSESHLGNQGWQVSENQFVVSASTDNEILKVLLPPEIVGYMSSGSNYEFLIGTEPNNKSRHIISWKGVLSFRPPAASASNSGIEITHVEKNEKTTESANIDAPELDKSVHKAAEEIISKSENETESFLSESETESESNENVYCTNCGALKKKDRYCTQCGFLNNKQTENNSFNNGSSENRDLMELRYSDDKVSDLTQEATKDLIFNVISRNRITDNEHYYVLSSKRSYHFIQASLEGYDTNSYILEYAEEPNKVFRCKFNVKPEEVETAFCSFLEQDGKWKTDFEWALLEESKNSFLKWIFQSSEKEESKSNFLNSLIFPCAIVVISTFLMLMNIIDSNSNIIFIKPGKMLLCSRILENTLIGEFDRVKQICKKVEGYIDYKKFDTLFISEDVDSNKYYIDPSRISGVPSNPTQLQVQYLVNFKKIIIEDEYKYLSSIITAQFDCKSNSARNVIVTGFANLNAKDELFSSNFSESKWEAIEKDTVNNLMKNYVCHYGKERKLII